MAVLVLAGSLYRCCQAKQAGDRDTMLHRCPGNPPRFDSKHRKREVTPRTNRHLSLHLPQRFHPDIPPLPRMPMLTRASLTRRHASNPPHTAEEEARYHLRRFRRFTHHAQPIHPEDPAQRRKNMGSPSLSGTIKILCTTRQHPPDKGNAPHSATANTSSTESLSLFFSIKLQ